MMLMLSKQIIQTNHALRRGTMRDRAAFMGNDVRARRSRSRSTSCCGAPTSYPSTVRSTRERAA